MAFVHGYAAAVLVAQEARPEEGGAHIEAGGVAAMCVKIMRTRSRLTTFGFAGVARSDTIRPSKQHSR